MFKISFCLTNLLEITGKKTFKLKDSINYGSYFSGTCKKLQALEN